MKIIASIACVILTLHSFGQTKRPEDFGFRHFQIFYKGDTVDILIKSKKGEENIPKPLLFFCQGSMPQPLIKTDGEKSYGVFPFKPDSLATYYHITIVGKPYVPVIVDVKNLGANFCYVDSNGRITKNYSDRNLLDYYVKRDIEVLKFLQQQQWVSADKLILAGHSEGSTVAAKIASVYPKVTHLVYSGGNPFGRIMSIIGQSRQQENDSTKMTDGDFAMWQSAVENPNDLDYSQGDTRKATVEFSAAPIHYLEKLKIPVLISYGTKDWSAPFNDYLRVETIRNHKTNFTFNAYIGTEHNFFPVQQNGEINHTIFNWNKVADDWLRWLNRK